MSKRDPLLRRYLMKRGKKRAENIARADKIVAARGLRKSGRASRIARGKE
jgi:hypothetical protein